MHKVLGFFAAWCGLSVFCAGASFGVAPANPRATDSGASVRVADDVTARRSAESPTRVRFAATGRAGATTTRTRSAVSFPRAHSTSLDGRIMERSSAPMAVSRVARAAKTNARSGKNVSSVVDGFARSATVSRATALFNDVGKIGSGYAECRESYATCMDQICGVANDTYRRCFCSDRYNQIRDAENALDQAMIMLQQFEDNNLNAVDKTAAEVTAMYTATVGEQAVKKDTSAAAKMLDNINDLLSGKSSSQNLGGSGSLGILDLDFSTNMDDMWSGDGFSSIFSSGTTDLSNLEGSALFNAAQKQCSRLSQNNCDNDAAFTMSKSSYNILITQDCNTYEKGLNTKREKVAAAVRTAEKYLREARLEEYRSHNSADVNECIAKVRAAMLADTACGPDYKRCLDPTGAYINLNTGEAIYSPRLFQLEETINLDGVTSSGTMVTDILGANQSYDKFLENYRKYVTRELDTCRDIADFVWSEFKRNAIIEIAQAQSNKIEEVKSSCVDVISQCYDATTKSLVDMDKNTATAAGVLGRYASKDMCREQVIACAMLYAPKNVGACTFDARGHLTSDTSTDCGLQSLLNYVGAVNDINIVSKCGEAIDDYLAKLCTPDDSSSYDYPYNCHGMRNDEDMDNNMSLGGAIKKYAARNCWNPADTANKDKTDSQKYELLDSDIQLQVQTKIADVVAGVRDSLRSICERNDGIWYNSKWDNAQNKYVPVVNLDSDQTHTLARFYNMVSGRVDTDEAIASWGFCYENSEQTICLWYNNNKDGEDGKPLTLTEWNSTTESCTFLPDWYEKMCDRIGGYYEDDMCYIVSE